MTTQSARYRVNPSEETIELGFVTIRFLVTGGDSQGTVAMFELLVAAREKLMPPSHSHDAFEETVYGIEGTLTWTVDGAPIEVAPGQALCIPRGAVHRFDNEKDEPARALSVISPAVLSPAFFREMAEVTAKAVNSPPDRERMIAVMLRHGLTPALPA
ncbi:MAG TPA: cupin domain-containing protein [Thermomicrobiaceae bacterium]|nr:cupin domain-containing protein [Thermomicrobiaceae bacterium]